MSEASKEKILVTGDAIMDVDALYRTTARLSPETGKPIVIRDKETTRPGGANAVAAMVRGLGEPCLTGFGGKAPSVKTRVKIDGVEQFREDRDNLDHISDATADLIVRQAMRLPADGVVLVADYGKGVVTDYLFRQLVATGRRIIVDPSRHLPLDWYRGAWAICPNRAEADGRLPADILAIGFEAVCLKLDKDGLWASNGKGCAWFNSISKQPPVDPCGAGDIVLASLGVATVRGLDWHSACKYANAAAGVKCGKVGAVPVTPAEVEAILTAKAG